MTIRSRQHPNPKRERGMLSESPSLAHELVALILTRRVSEGFCGIVRPSLTRRVVMYPSPAANPLNQQVVTLRVGVVLSVVIIAGRKAWGCFYVGPRLGLSSFASSLRQLSLSRLRFGSRGTPERKGYLPFRRKGRSSGLTV